MDAVAYLLCALLFFIAFVHLLWATGSTWPCEDEITLAKTVVGSRGIEKMPPRAASLFVSVCLLAAGVFALTMRETGPLRLPRNMDAMGGLILAVIFGLRGVLGVLPAFERMAPEMPFLKLNRRFYSPLSFGIGVGFILLVFAIPNWSWRLS